MIGLILVVFQGIINAKFSLSGTFFALSALACMSIGAIFQKRIQQPPSEVLPLQYGVSLFMCLLFVPFKPFHIEPTIGFIIPVLWLGLVISVAAQLLLYRLIMAGNLVNVTSLFYLVPGVTAIMDYLFLGNKLSNLSIIGMIAIIFGLLIIFHVKEKNIYNYLLCHLDSSNKCNFSERRPVAIAGMFGGINASDPMCRV